MRHAGAFPNFARRAARFVGHPAAFVTAVVVILLWAVMGPVFGFSDTWQLVVNTATTVLTFLMVFLVQHTQNRDAEAIQIKLDELIRATKRAHNALMDVEEMEETDLDTIRSRYAELADRARRGSGPDQGSPEVPEPGVGPEPGSRGSGRQAG